MSWTQAICRACWEERNPGRSAYHTVGADSENCSYCGQETDSGIFVRDDPTTVPFPKEAA